LSDRDFSLIHDKINRLSKKEKQELKQCLLKSFPQKEDAHIFYLISKTKTKTRVQIMDDTITEKIKKYYVELNRIPEIALLLKAMQYNHDLEIIFDFDSDSINNIEPTSHKNVRARIDAEQNKIFIGAKIDENKLLGIMAHEFCHVAVIMLFNNEAKPYEKSDNESAEKFKILHKKFQDQINQAIIVDEDGIIKLVYDNYKQEKWDAELIVRVPHILAHYEENGEKILNDNAGGLLIFYNELIIPKLNYFIENSYLIRPKKHIEYINLKLNYLFKIEESSFRLKKPIRLGEDFFCSKIKPNILLIGSINTFKTSILGVVWYLS
jgi:hypothetical protein